MPRKPIIAGNWKMHKTRDEASDFVKAFLPLISGAVAQSVLCPTFTTLHRTKMALEGTAVGLGAQNCHFETTGAFTGEISAPMLKDVGCDYCIIGHSERRQYFAETDEFINRKAQALYAVGITPIICVGETLEERESGKTEDVIIRQVRGCLRDLPADKVAASVIAYEPVWAIGTGKTATTAQAQEVHALIRKLVANLYAPDVAEAIRIQYGGSVKPDNAAELLSQPDIDGALVGGAALKPDAFAAIVLAAK